MFKLFRRETKPTWFHDYDGYKKSYVDLENDYNLILSKNFKQSLNANLNHNILLISDNLHKIEDFFLANLLQANGSYVVLDNSAGMYKHKTLPFFNYKCYIVKTFGYLYEDSKYCYNPFAYIESVDDIKEMVDLIFENVSYGAADKFFMDTMKLFFHIACLYVYESKLYPNPTLMDVVDIYQEFGKDTMKDKMLELELKWLNSKAVHYYKVVKDYKKSDVEQLVDAFNETQIAQMLQKTEVREMLSRDTLNLKGLSVNKQILYIQAGQLGFLATTLLAHAAKEIKKNNDKNEANRHVQFILPNPYKDGGDDLILDTIHKINDEKRASQLSFLAKISNKEGIHRSLTNSHLFDTIIYRDGCKKSDVNFLSFLLLKSENLLSEDELVEFPASECLIFINGLNPIRDAEYQLSSHQYYKTLGGRSCS